MDKITDWIPSPRQNKFESGDFDDSEKFSCNHSMHSLQSDDMKCASVSSTGSNYGYGKQSSSAKYSDVESYKDEAEVAEPENNETGEPESYLNALMSNLSNFNQVYKVKLDQLERTGLNELELNKRKIALYQNWVKDVNEQNAILIEAVGEMESETERRIELMQQELQKTTKLTETQMLLITKYEQQALDAASQQMKDQRNIEQLRVKLSKMETHQRNKLQTTQSDVESLVTLITRIRDSGVWDVDGLNFESKTYDRLFKQYPNLPGSQMKIVLGAEEAEQRAKEAADFRKKTLDALATAAVQASHKMMEGLDPSKQNVRMKVTATRLGHGRIITTPEED